MTIVDRQLHGYRQGHQLLSASVQLPKDDQSAIDRLSDVAGPLRPREAFEPYLTAYPLPSGERYVLARTWQDLTVSRAGCVRTLSLIIPVTEWAGAASLLPFVNLLQLDHLPQDGDATRVTVVGFVETALPPAPIFRASELLEALFLEDAKPVVLFDAPAPELIATRLLTALWPSMRRSFALSTFALSPRKIGGRDLDLVFAPKDARAKFADWQGRRVDGRSTKVARHRWTGTIVDRVFGQPIPRLLTSTEIGLVDEGGPEIDNAATLRIALMWDELLAKLETTPTAALGLLDIANSGKVRDSLALTSLEPALADAARRGGTELPEAEAWNFLSAMARKIKGRSFPTGSDAVSAAVEGLAGRAPEGAVALLSLDDPRKVLADLSPRIAAGIGKAFDDRAAQALLSAQPSVLAKLVTEGGDLARKVVENEALTGRLGEIFSKLETKAAEAFVRDLLPLLTSDWQLPLVKPLLATLNGQQLADELAHLGTSTDFAAEDLIKAGLERATALGATEAVRSTLAKLPVTERRDKFLASLLKPSIEDAHWLLRTSVLNGEQASDVFVDLVTDATTTQLAAILVDRGLGDEALTILMRRAPHLVQRTLLANEVPVETFANLVRVTLEKLDGATKAKVAGQALRRCLGVQFGGDEVVFISAMLGAIGAQLDGAWAGRLGLSKTVNATIASRNLVAFAKAAPPARHRIVLSIGDIAESLRNRRQFDLNSSAAEAAAQLLLEADKVTPQALLRAAGDLLPMLLRSRGQPASLMIVAAFPALYRKLSEEDDQDLWNMLPFLTRDRCKTARQELVSAFMGSSWPPEHLALTACRCGAVNKILRVAAKSRAGTDYIRRISAGGSRLPKACREAVERAIGAIQADGRSKHARRT